MERFVVLVVGLLTHWVLAALAILAVFSYVTVVQRIRFTMRELRRELDPD
jgi:hypothetical protein